MSKNKQIDMTNPPGGVLIWLIVTVELLTIFLFLIFLLVEKNSDSSTYNELIQRNNITIALINTAILMFSGFLVSKMSDTNKSSKKLYLLLSSILLGLFFLVIKSYEYHEKIKLGLTHSKNIFYTFYWFLTLFHAVHVIIALLLMSHQFFLIKRSKSVDNEYIESVSVFWHLCDLIWIILIPFLYGFYHFKYSATLSLILFMVKSFIIFKYFIRIGQSHIFWIGYSILLTLLFLFLIGFNLFYVA